MLDNWESEYSELKEYLARSPQIKIGKNVIRIPDNFRTDFYRLFDKVRSAFIEGKYRALLDEAFTLKNNYDKAAEQITKSLNLSGIKLSSNLNWFMNDPVDGLARSLHKLLFDLLKDKLDSDTFELEAAKSLENSFRQLFKLGYQRWVALSLLNLLSPDKALVIPVEEVKRRCHEPEPDEKKGLLEEELPELEVMETLYLKRDIEEDAFILSYIIIHSAKLNRYISVGADLVDATWSVKEVSNKREWQKLRELGRLYEAILNWPDLVVYVDNQPEDIALVADFGRFCRPDIIIECMEQAEWYQKENLDRVSQNYNFFNPILGSYVVSRPPVSEVFNNLLLEPVTTGDSISKNKTPPEEESVEHSGNIQILNVGYDQSKLSPIVNILSSGRK